MDINARPIHTEAEYDAALAQIDTLMDALPGTADGDLLDLLITSIEAYEARRWSIERVRMISNDGLTQRREDAKKA